MKKASFLSLLLPVYLLCSCEYQPSGIYDHTVSRDVAPPQIQVVELNITSDTLYLYGGMEITFKFSSDHQKISTVQLLIDGTPQGYVNSESGTFYIDGGSLGEGTHDLDIEVYTASGTGSLADYIGAEGFVSSNSWKLIVGSPYEPGLVATAENGLLHLKWAEFRSSNFKEFIVYKSTDPYSNARVIKTTTNEFTDSLYIGEGAKYTVVSITQGDHEYSTCDLVLDPDLPVLSFTASDSNKYTVNWTRSKFFNAVSSYKIYQNDSQAKETSDPGDTLYNVKNALFGDDLHFQLRLVPWKTSAHTDPDYDRGPRTDIYTSLGFPFKPVDYDAQCYHINKDEFVYRYCDSMIRYSVSQKHATEQFTYHNTACNSCNFVNLRNSNTGRYQVSFANCEQDIMLTKGSDLSRYSIHKLLDITGGLYPFIAISDSGTALIQNKDGGLSLLDLTTGDSTGYYKLSFTGDWPRELKISPDGQYFSVSADTFRIVEFKNGQFRDVWKVPYPCNIKFHEFDPLNPLQVVTWNGTEFSFRACSDFSVVSGFALTDHLLLDIDYYNHEMLTFSPGHLYIRSLSDGSLKYDLPVHINPENYPDYCYLVNHTIVYGRGLLHFIY
jgi:hypothetical protein